MMPRSRDGAEVGLELELEPDGVDGAGVFELEVALRRAARRRRRTAPTRRLVSSRSVKSGWVASSTRARCEVGDRRVEGALVGRPVHQELERAVHERALARPRRRRLRESLEVGEPERERALLERRAGARRQRPGGREAHGSEGTRGGVTARGSRIERISWRCGGRVRPCSSTRGSRPFDRDRRAGPASSRPSDTTAALPPRPATTRSFPC